MRSRTVTVHYCDHCSKRYFHIPAMQKHERGCTANPDRKCGMCEWHYENGADYDLHGKTVSQLVSIAVGEDNGGDGMARLREVTHNCPACILSALRFMGKANNEYYKEGRPFGTPPYPEFEFDVESEFQSWRNDASLIMNEQNCYS